MKRIILIIALAAVFAISAFAEAAHRTEKFSSFSGVVVSGNIIATLQEGDSYSVRLDVDARIMDYVNLSLTGNELAVEVKEKDFPNTLKAQLRKKDNALLPTNVTITAPFSKGFDSITLKGNARLTTKGSIIASNTIIINALNNSSIIDAEVKGQKLEMLLCNNCSAEITAAVKEFELSSSNNASLTADLKVGNVVLDAYNNSDVVLKGSADKMLISGKNSADIDALELSAKVVEVSVTNNCQCNLKATQLLNILSVLNGASLIYMGEPVIKIGKIANSSVSSASQANQK